ncbi:glycosyltransferase family 1 protein [Hoyosella rhizosphaerae]|uniref:Glycosyl transferase n=1 Tax=Hoyosella rhizosphaerae TaxID=1755582 RepID=A0A916UMU1_9ACTN|nr:glycosyltransferase family 1 protein [Hoyosella rhizosphaerae]MBN4925263.1 glycosyltransferase family 1 protein [Hoyosella rhizosphaerae]GGC76674.1 putative glycosyl transferase [Hoyosella rhizosphaerae]
MRIAIVSESFLPNVNGVTNSVLRVLEHLKRNGHEAIVIAPDAIGDEEAVTEYEGFPILRVPAVMVPMVTSLPVGLPQPWITNALREFDPDVVHLASPFLLGAGGLGAAHRLNIPTVAIFQTDVAGFADSYGLGLTSRAAWRWTRKIHRGASRTLAPSTVSVNDLEQHGIPRVHRWGRGVDVDRFNPVRRSGELRESWTPEGKLIVGFVGRLAPEKHVERLAVLHHRDDVQLVIVGDGPALPKLQRLMPTAIFTGQLGGLELAQAYASFDVFVHTGDHETFCQAIQEGLASGIPVIGPDAGGPKDLIAHARTGFLLPVPGFEGVLSGAIDTFLDPVVRSQFGRAARRSVLKRTWPAICDELLGHYAEVAGYGVGELSATA